MYKLFLEGPEGWGQKGEGPKPRNKVGWPRRVWGPRKVPCRVGCPLFRAFFPHPLHFRFFLSREVSSRIVAHPICVFGLLWGHFVWAPGTPGSYKNEPWKPKRTIWVVHGRDWCQQFNQETLTHREQIVNGVGEGNKRAKCGRRFWGGVLGKAVREKEEGGSGESGSIWKLKIVLFVSSMIIITMIMVFFFFVFLLDWPWQAWPNWD